MACFIIIDEYRLTLFERFGTRSEKIVAALEMEYRIDKCRSNAFKAASGNVLEVGTGVGMNLEVLKKNKAVKSLVLLEKSKILCDVLKNRIEKAEFPFPIFVIEGDVCDLPFEDNSFDTVMSSFLLCSIFGNSNEALSEMSRVSKINGRVLMLERGLAKGPIKKKIFRVLKLFPNPRVPWEFGYFEDRNPMDIIQRSPLLLKSVNYDFLGMHYLISAFKPFSHQPVSSAGAAVDSSFEVPSSASEVFPRLLSGQCASLHRVYLPSENQKAKDNSGTRSKPWWKLWQ